MTVAILVALTTLNIATTAACATGIVRQQRRHAEHHRQQIPPEIIETLSTHIDAELRIVFEPIVQRLDDVERHLPMIRSDTTATEIDVHEFHRRTQRGTLPAAFTVDITSTPDT